MSNWIPKPKAPLPPPPPPAAPTAATSSVVEAGQNAANTSGYSSMISTTPQGLTRKASTAKTSLIGGN